MRTILATAFLFTILGGCRWPNTVTGNGNIVTEKRAVSGFTKVSVGGPFEVEITPGESYSLQISADDNLMELVNVDKDGSALKIRLREGYNIRTRNDIKVLITMPGLNELACAGSGSIKVAGLLTNDDKLSMDVAGSGTISAEVNTPRVDANIAGSGTVNIKGQTENVKLSIGGSGDYNGKGLMSEHVKVTIGGSGTAYVFASKTLDVNVAGSGDVYYGGEPEIKKKIAGSGNIRAL